MRASVGQDTLKDLANGTEFLFVELVGEVLLDRGEVRRCRLAVSAKSLAVRVA